MDCEKLQNFAGFFKDENGVKISSNKWNRTAILMPMCIGTISLMVLTGCVTTPTPVTVALVAAPIVVPLKPTVLTPEADNALKAAEQTIIETRVRRALWTAATEQLGRARAAAKTFDSDLTIKHAREAIALCQLSLQQKQSPPVTW